MFDPGMGKAWLQPKGQKGASSIFEAEAPVEGLGAVLGHDLEMKGGAPCLSRDVDKGMYGGAPEPTSSLLGHDVEVVQEHVTPAQLNGVAPAQRRVADQVVIVLDLEHEAKGFVSQKVLESTLTFFAQGVPILLMESSG